MTLEVVFDRRLEHGFCVGIRIPADVAAVEALGQRALLAEECAFAAGLPPIRRRTWIGGRVAMREGLRRAGLDAPAVQSDARGAPAFPAGIVGSISHKEHLAVALVALADPGGARIGVDVEIDVPRSVDVSSRVLAADEAKELATLDPAARAHEVLLRFSAKEAIYKALDPFVQRYVGFQEVSVTPDPHGGARVTPRLHDGEGPFAFEVRWLRFDRTVLTTAQVRATAV